MTLNHDVLVNVLLYEPTTGVFTWKGLDGKKQHLNGTIAGVKHSAGYLSITVEHKQYLAHRLAWFYVYKEWPNGSIDHKDRNKKNNKITNLRISTQSQNGANQNIKKNNRTGLKGVGFRKDISKWRARIMVNRKEITLGVFDAPEDAAFAYEEASKKYFGEFANSGAK